ncbi:MAG: adenylate/guanylate cyclase domain-containing protein, partial [Pseudomonadota bacterium]
SQDRLCFTVHGDQVNVAARLEQQNKQYGSYILVGENTVEACGSKFTFKRVGEVTVRGRETPTEIYTVEDKRKT